VNMVSIPSFSYGECRQRGSPEAHAGKGRLWGTFLLLRTLRIAGKFRRICMPESILSYLERVKMRDARSQKLHLWVCWRQNM